MLTFHHRTVAKQALRRKKTHEASLEQTMGQIGTLEQQINAIESANINRETLAAMERAGQAMKQIHGKLTPEKVDETMCVMTPPLAARLASEYEYILFLTLTCCLSVICREVLREQNDLSKEIVAAMNTVNMDSIDEDDLEAELENLQQEQLDNKMLETGSVPVSDTIKSMPSVANGERKSDAKTNYKTAGHWLAASLCDLVC